MSTSSAPIRARSSPGRRLLLGVVAIVALLVAAIWILPGMLDWNRFRSSIASLVAAGIGRPVQINGNITLTLLPQPVLTATDLDVEDAGDGAVMQVHAVRLRVALGPLIAGRIDARELTMQGADLRLPWPPPAGAFSRRPPAWITGLQARAEDSRLQIGGLVLGGVDAVLTADPDTGTLSVAGAATLFDRPTRFTIRLGRPGRDGAAPLDISLDGQDSPAGKLHDTGGTISGTIEADGSLAGRVTARGPDLSQLFPAPATAFRADGRISAAGGVLVADELALEIGGSPARGAVALRVQPELRLDLALSTSRLDLDAWTPVLLRVTQPGLPRTIPTGIDLSADSATLAGGLLRQVRTAVDIDADAVTVREATALIPGDAKLALLGRFPQRDKTAAPTVPAAPRPFEGAGTLIAPDLRTTLRWLEPIAPAIVRAVPDGAFRTADITAKLTADAAQISFTDLEGKLDSATIQGGLAIRLGTRPAISFGLTMDRLLLDPFLPSPEILADPAAAYAATLKSLAAAAFDSDLKLQLREADWRGTHFGPLAIDAQSEAGHLTIRRLETTLAGLHAALSGTLGDAGRISEGRMELTAEDVAPLSPVLIPLLPPVAAAIAPLLRGAANLILTASGPPDALALRAALDLGDLRAEAQPVLNVPAHRWTGPLTVQHPNAARLLQQLGFPSTGHWLGDGSLSIIAQAARTPGRLDLANVDLVAGELRAHAQLALAGHNVQGRIKAETLTLPPIDPRSPDPLPLADIADIDAVLHVEAGRVLFGLAPSVTDLVADLTTQDGALAIDALSARRDGATLAGAARIDPAISPKITVRGQLDGLALNPPPPTNPPTPAPLTNPPLAAAPNAPNAHTATAAAPLEIVAGTLSVRLDIKGEGSSPAALTATLAGTGTVAIADAEIAGIDLPAATAALTQPDPAKLLGTLRNAMLTGSTAAASIDIPFDLQGGVATLHATAKPQRPTSDPTPTIATLNATLELRDRTIDGRLVLLPGPGLPPLPVRLDGSITNPTRTPELAGAARWLAERP